MINKERSPSPLVSLAFANYHLYTRELSQISLERRTIINTLNPHSFYIAEKDKTFRDALENSDILLPDGIGIVWAFRFLQLKSIHRISGMDVFQHLLDRISTGDDPAKRRIFFLGASNATLDKIRRRLQREYPNVEVGCWSPPFKAVFSEEDNQFILKKIKEFDPFILFVGMTAPKQEKWVFQNKNEISSEFICSIGAVFDYYAGTIRRPGAFWRRVGLEWFIRFLREPKRLWKRNLISGPFFILRVFQLKLDN